MNYPFEDLDEMLEHINLLIAQADEVVRNPANPRRGNAYLTAVGRRGAFEDVRNMLVCFQRNEAKKAYQKPALGAYRYRVEYMTAGNPRDKLQGFKGQQIFTEEESAQRSFKSLDSSPGTTSVELWQERCLRHN